MMMKDENTGVAVVVSYDDDGFPLVSISTGGDYFDEYYRPSVEVKLNDVMIHDMFDEDDQRWNDGPGPAGVVGWRVVETGSDAPPKGMQDCELYSLAYVLAWLEAHSYEAQRWRLLPVRKGDVEDSEDKTSLKYARENIEAKLEGDEPENQDTV